MTDVRNQFAERKFRTLLSSVGITPNGTAPQDIQVHEPTLYWRVLIGGSLALGEAYQRGEWSCRDIPEFCLRIRQLQPTFTMQLAGLSLQLLNSLTNLQSKALARESIHQHYDLSNEFYSKWLDWPLMQYSCAYFDRGAQTLEEAQKHKLQLICEKLQLKPGMQVLDIGCGWGGLAHFMASQYGVRVVGITLSEEQLALARARCDRQAVDILLLDYRDAPKQLWKFDRIVSVGMFEHVGNKNHRQFMQVVSDCLEDNGIALVHSIFGTGTIDPWIHKYIFRGGTLPRRDHFEELVDEYFVTWDRHEFGQSYARTLVEWHANFVASWDEIKSDPPKIAFGPAFDQPDYPEWFFRTWEYYLLMCSGSFKGAHITLWQSVLSKQKRPLGYTPVR